MVENHTNHFLEAENARSLMRDAVRETSCITEVHQEGFLQIRENAAKILGDTLLPEDAHQASVSLFLLHGYGMRGMKVSAELQDEIASSFGVEVAAATAKMMERRERGGWAHMHFGMLDGIGKNAEVALWLSCLEDLKRLDELRPELRESFGRTVAMCDLISRNSLAFGNTGLEIKFKQAVMDADKYFQDRYGISPIGNPRAFITNLPAIKVDAILG